MTHDLPFWFIPATVIPSLLISWGAGFGIRRWAPRWGLVDHPAARKVHVSPTPLGGGLAIWLAVVVPLVAGLAVLWLIRNGAISQDWLPRLAQKHLNGLAMQTGSLWFLLTAATVLMLVGLADDRWGLGWKPRLAVQFLVAAVCVVWQGWRLTLFLDVPILTWLLSVLWIVGLINS
ncbi:MAG: undecaprenyl/decaprenyl-phosphate alpha-N-acetylglucosaminyl 1-phosphate transferase, partial [Planctomycetes bacterium]|nr:undecaprenyl/decaprenyl-phosphate alpha-N-acetylglucosaminyl 1-phosphate transferase [Planctomycetota bacterium]